jgi:hypothetical protein
MFPGGNTPEGFFSYYQYILPQDRAEHIFCLKGGPGVGKSTFIKSIGAAAVEVGHAVEYMHCSSDPASLDGLVIPGLKTALIDGTAPHVVDPKNPGAVDEIVNLGAYWDLPEIKRHRQEIMEANAEVRGLFARAYQYLRAARALYDDLNAAHAECYADVAADAEMGEIEGLFQDYPKGMRLGCERKLFASAVTPEGPVHYLGNLLHGYRYVFALSGEGRLPSEFVAAVASEAVHRGLDVEEYYCPMEPGEKIEHLLIPALSSAFTVSNRHHAAAGNNAKIIDFGIYLNRAALSKLSSAVEFDTEQFGRLFDQAVETLKKAKQMHDYMETFYAPNMDFDSVAGLRDGLLGRILGK